MRTDKMRHAKGASVMRAGWVGVVALTCVLGAGARPSGQAPAAGAASGVHTLKVQGNVYMMVGAGGNIALQISDDGVLLVDTGTTANADKVVAAVRELTNKPIRYIINTSADADHVGGNDTIGKLGSTIAGGNVGAGAGDGLADRHVREQAERAVLQRRGYPDDLQAGPHRRRFDRVLPTVGRDRRRRVVQPADVPRHRPREGRQHQR